MTPGSGPLRTLNRRHLVRGGSLALLAAALSRGNGVASDESLTDSPFAEMLRAAPAELAAGGVPYVSFLDVAAASPDVPAHPHLGVLDGEILFGQSDNWDAFFGFGDEEILATLQLHQGDDSIRLIKGTFDPAAVQEVWRGNGYVPLDDDPSLMTYGGDNMFGEHSDLGIVGMLMGEYDCLCLINDDTVVASRRLDLVKAANSVSLGESDHLGQSDALRRIGQAGIAGCDSAFVYPGTDFLNTGFAVHPALDAEQRDDALAFEKELLAAHGPMPEVHAVLLGTFPGGTGESVAFVDLAVADADRQAACERYLAVATARFEHHLSVVRRRPYTEFLTLVDGRVDGTGLVRLEVQAIDEGGPDLIDLQSGKDLSFLQFG